jgi:hypothetical protein
VLLAGNEALDGAKSLHVGVRSYPHQKLEMAVERWINGKINEKNMMDDLGEKQ